MRRLLTLLSLAFLGGCAAPEEAWVYVLSTRDGHKACLVAVAHLAIKPLQSSPRVGRCLGEASIVAFETDPTGQPSFTWAGYARQPSDPRLEDLPHIDAHKVRAALAAAGYSAQEVKYLSALHPAGVYRALLYGKALATKETLSPNIDLIAAAWAKANGKPILSFEGMDKFYANDKSIPVDQLGELIARLTDLHLSPERRAKTVEKINTYALSYSILPNVDSAYQRKVEFDTSIMGLPSYTVVQDVDNRNALMAEGIARTIREHPNALVFIGAAHIGGPQSVLRLLDGLGVSSRVVQTVGDLEK